MSTFEKISENQSQSEEEKEDDFRRSQLTQSTEWTNVAYSKVSGNYTVQH